MPSPLDWLDPALADLDRRGLRRELRTRTSSKSSAQIEIDGQLLVNFGSNGYLGLAADPRIAAAVRAAIEEFGWGSGASPLVTGRTSLHAELEKKLADFTRSEAALLFPTGYAANTGAITALVGKGDAIYSDERNHASIIDGCRLSGATIHVYRHADPANLAEQLRQGTDYRRRLIVTESLFSMGGDLAPLIELTQLAQERNAMVIVDEAHAVGVFGEHGRGLCEQFGVEKQVTVLVGTLSKALGSVGGFAVGCRSLIDWLANRARPYIFSTAPPAAAAAAAQAALDVVNIEPQRRERLLTTAQRFRNELSSAGFTRLASTSQIVSIVLGSPERALTASAELRRHGFFVPAIRPPSVPEGQSLLRISLTASHSDQQIEDLIAALRPVAK